ncbi:MAG: hypothetical protein EOP38_08055 [Rubrivivax sp.]|nr:MAG: hypothetical protein EOP38_08055 [Rubrivivax sp.]
MTTSRGTPATSDQPSGPRTGQEPAGSPQPMAPGDEARPGTPGTGEDVCRACGGSGRIEQSPCPECAGTGFVTVGIGGA